MKVGIVAAWEPELNSVYSKWNSTETYEIAGWKFNEYSMDHLHVIAAISGVGKVKCAACTQLLISRFNPEELFMTGICGGLSEAVSGGDIIIPTVTFEHDVHEAGQGEDPIDLYNGRSAKIVTEAEMIKNFDAYAKRKGVSIHYGTVVSGDQRIRDTELSSHLRDGYQAIGVDQEIAAFSHVCYLNKTPFLCIKGVSDKANDRCVEDQIKFKLKAADQACGLLMDYLQFRGL